MLWTAARTGVIELTGTVSVPAVAWFPSARQTRAWAIAPVTAPYALTHHGCATEAGLLLEANRAPRVGVRALRPGRALASAAQRTAFEAVGRLPRRGDVLPPVEDLEVVAADGRRTEVECASEHDRRANLAAKSVAFPASIACVAAGFLVAQRADSTAPTRAAPRPASEDPVAAAVVVRPSSIP